MNTRNSDDNAGGSSIYFSLENQIVEALLLVDRSLDEVKRRDTSWMWVIIGIHSALQGSLCTVLRRTDGFQLLTPEQEQQAINRMWNDRQTGQFTIPEFKTKKGKPVEATMDAFMRLYEKAQQEERTNYLGSKPLAQTESEKLSIKQLNWVRNQLIHYGVSSLSLDESRLIDIVGAAICAVEQLLFKTIAAGTGGQPLSSILKPSLSEEANRLVDSIFLKVHSGPSN